MTYRIEMQAESSSDPWTTLHEYDEREVGRLTRDLAQYWITVAKSDFPPTLVPHSLRVIAVMAEEIL